MEKSTVTRRNQILKMLAENEELKTSSLSDYFDVTTETIRKDLLYLQNTGAVKKLHGRVRLSTKGSDTPLDLRTFQMRNEKTLIAKQALAMIENNSTIYIDGGSTALEIAKLLNQKEGLVVITTSLSAANYIAKQNNTVYIASGFVEGPSMIIHGPFLFESIKQFKPVVSFMGTNGVLFHDGPTSKNFYDIEAKNEIVLNSNIAVVVCDSSKFSESGMLQYTSWSNIDFLITDSGIPVESREQIEKQTKIIIAEEKLGSMY
ncbi:MAG: DeoR/GlpR transcriptional regulator [Chloroflexi bacterium]|nr:DeoR/GlpR transcriptional regulator [Chloroflexota bacterium]